MRGVRGTKNGAIRLASLDTMESLYYRYRFYISLIYARLRLVAEQFDVTIIGSGPGGYVAAVRGRTNSD